MILDVLRAFLLPKKIRLMRWQDGSSDYAASAYLQRIGARGVWLLMLGGKLNWVSQLVLSFRKSLGVTGVLVMLVNIWFAVGVSRVGASART